MRKIPRGACARIASSEKPRLILHEIAFGPPTLRDPDALYRQKFIDGFKVIIIFLCKFSFQFELNDQVILFIISEKISVRTAFEASDKPANV